MANQVVLMESRTRVTRFLPNINRITMANRNGATAVMTRACGLNSSKMLAGSMWEFSARLRVRIKLSSDMARPSTVGRIAGPAQVNG